MPAGFPRKVPEEHVLDEQGYTVAGGQLYREKFANWIDHLGDLSLP